MNIEGKKETRELRKKELRDKSTRKSRISRKKNAPAGDTDTVYYAAIQLALAKSNISPLFNFSFIQFNNFPPLSG